MIDLDRMDEQLTSAVTANATVTSPAVAPARVAPAPAARAPVAPARPAVVRERRRPRPVVAPAAPSGTAPAHGPSSPADDVRRLLEAGLLDEADDRIAAAADRTDALTWATMRALLDGRRDDVRSGLSEMQELARASDDPAVGQRYWVQRYWAAVEWGNEGERLDVLDHCRERAYRFDELDWWGNLTLLLATLGKADEACRSFDATLELMAGAPADGVTLDVVTNLVEGAALLGDSARVARLPLSGLGPEGRMVIVGPAAVCKGSVDRYRGLALAALGRGPEADLCFRAAAAAHRAIGAGPLLARTQAQAERVGLAA